MEVKHISKSYKRIKALDDINLVFNTGLYGLLGENGAGKSTLIRIIIGEERPTRGEVLYKNHSVSRNEEYYQSMGYLPQNFKAPEEMKGIEYLNYIGIYKGLNKSEVNKNISQLVDVLNLSGHIDKRIKSMSGGTIRRLGIAQAFLNKPSFVILDEPTAGLDITERRNFREFVSNYSKENTVIISTHIVSDIEYIASDLILLKKGVLISKGSYKEQLGRLQGMVWENTNTEEKIFDLKKRVESFGGTITNFKGEDERENHLRYVHEDKLCDSSIGVISDLNDYYLWKMGGTREC